MNEPDRPLRRSDERTKSLTDGCSSDWHCGFGVDNVGSEAPQCSRWWHVDWNSQVSRWREAERRDCLCQARWVDRHHVGFYGRAGELLFPCDGGGEISRLGSGNNLRNGKG